MLKPKILVIEDEEGIRRFIGKALEADFEVHEAADGEEGLKQARWIKPALILLDLRMPGLDGLTVLAKLKGNKETSAFPVIIVSAHGETDALLATQRGGAIDHIIKPFSIEELRKAIGKHVLLT